MGHCRDFGTSWRLVGIRRLGVGVGVGVVALGCAALASSESAPERDFSRRGEVWGPSTERSGPRVSLPGDARGVGKIILEENFDGSLGEWQGRWLYENTNMQSLYFAKGNCDPDYRGNLDDGIWFSDDKECGSYVADNPIRIEFDNDFAQYARVLAFDICRDSVVFSIYDRDGALDVSELIPRTCWEFGSYSWEMNNGISAFEWSAVGESAEGNTTIDDVRLTLDDGPCDIELRFEDAPQRVKPGDRVEFWTTAFNDCREIFAFDSAAMHIDGPVGRVRPLYEGRSVSLDPGESLGATVGLRLPHSTPLGNYRVDITIAGGAGDRSRGI